MTAMNIHIQARASRTASSGMKISTAVPSERTKRSKYCSRIASRGIQGSLNTVPATFPPAPKDIAQARPPVLQHPPHRGSRARQRTPQRIQVACNRTSYQIIFVWNGRHLTSPSLLPETPPGSPLGLPKHIGRASLGWRRMVYFGSSGTL